LTFRNIRHHNPSDARTLFEIGLPFYDTGFVIPDDNKPKMKNFIIDGLTIIENGNAAANADYIKLFGDIDRLILSNVTVIREGQDKPAGHLVSFTEHGTLGLLVIYNVIANGFEKLIEGEEKIGRILSNNITFEK
jgi:hypothetical protein